MKKNKVEKSKKRDKRAFLDYSLIIVGIIIIGALLLNLDYILKPKNTEKADFSEKSERNIAEERPDISLSSSKASSLQVSADSDITDKKKKDAQDQAIRDALSATVSGSSNTKMTKASKQTINFTNFEQEKKKKEAYVAQGGRVGETVVEEGIEVVYENVKPLRSDEEVKPILEKQREEQEKLKELEKANRKKAEEEEKKIIQNAQNKKYEQDLGYLNDGERWYQGGTPKTSDVKVENGKKLLYVKGYGWINWKKATVGSREMSKGTEEGLSGILIGY